MESLGGSFVDRFTWTAEELGQPARRGTRSRAGLFSEVDPRKHGVLTDAGAIDFFPPTCQGGKNCQAMNCQGMNDHYK